jgi:hypothetical protein
MGLSESKAVERSTVSSSFLSREWVENLVITPSQTTDVIMPQYGSVRVLGSTICDIERFFNNVAGGKISARAHIYRRSSIVGTEAMLFGLFDT